VSESLLWAIAIVAGVIGAAVVAIYLFRPPD
jgi:uncharacterized membrane protein YsdA (DUF1294 family)